MITRTRLCTLFLLLAAWALTPASPTSAAWAQGLTQTQVDLSSAFNISSGILADGTSSSTGLDGGGCGYSEQAMTSTAPPNGTTPSYPTLNLPQGSNTIVFNFGPANAPDAFSGALGGPITLPSGQFTVLELIGTGVQGGQTGTVTVGYSDGSSDNFTQGFSDWFSGGPYNIGEAVALPMAYRDCATQDNRTFRVYNYEIAINATKTVSTLTMPNNRNIIILAATLVAIPGFGTSGGTPNPSAITVGSASQIPVTVLSEASYGGTVTLACSISPNIQTSGATAPTCSYSPASVTIGVGNPGSSTLTFTAVGPPKAGARSSTSGLTYAFWLPIPGLALAGIGWRSRSKRRKGLLSFLLLSLVAAAILMTPACVSYKHVGNVGTPPGQYTIAITGTDANGAAQLGAGGSVVVTVQQ